MTDYTSSLVWIDSQRDELVARLSAWSDINTGTENVAGIAAFQRLVRDRLIPLADNVEEIALSPVATIGRDGEPATIALGPALRAKKRASVAGLPRVLLNIHVDTVYPADHPFQKSSRSGTDRLRGPGVADAKGGLVVMLTAIEALERSPFAGGIAWEALINSDEEIGSPGSAYLLAQSAGANDLGLLFEPAMPDGSLVARRKGTGNFTVIVHGRSAHAGRDFARGRNAVVALSGLVGKLHALNGSLPGVTVNVGRFEGGGPTNVVPDLAIARVNVRIDSNDDESKLVSELQRLVGESGEKEGFRASLHGGIHSPAKVPGEALRGLMSAIESCGQEVNILIRWVDSGGASDGNKLAAAGLPNIDTLGPIGGEIHSPGEYVLIDSLCQRAKLTALLLMKIASGEIKWPGRWPDISRGAEPPKGRRGRRTS